MRPRKDYNIQQWIWEYASKNSMGLDALSPGEGVTYHLRHWNGDLWHMENLLRQWRLSNGCSETWGSITRENGLGTFEITTI